jgi:hypothetical protein
MVVTLRNLGECLEVHTKLKLTPLFLDEQDVGIAICLVHRKSEFICRKNTREKSPQ